MDKAVWFGAPYPDRVELAKKVISWGLELDIFSRERWPLAAYRGPSHDEYETSLQYKYRLAVENSCEFLYHSEKLFQSERAGCVTFYQGDPNLDLEHARGTFAILNRENIEKRESLSARILEAQHEFIFSSGWEYYSFRRLFTDIMSMARSLLES